MSGMKKTGFLAGIAAGAAGLAVYAASAGGADRPAHQDAARVAAGQALYVANCASCHGTALEGQANWRERDAEGYLPAPPHDASGHTWHHPTQQQFQVTKYGTAALVGNGYKSRMEGFGDRLSDREILDILAYIKSTWPAEVITRHNQMDASAGDEGAIWLNCRLEPRPTKSIA